MLCWINKPGRYEGCGGQAWHLNDRAPLQHQVTGSRNTPEHTQRLQQLLAGLHNSQVLWGGADICSLYAC